VKPLLGSVLTVDDLRLWSVRIHFCCTCTFMIADRPPELYCLSNAHHSSCVADMKLQIKVVGLCIVHSGVNLVPDSDTSR
jgi:hypothetical protein